MATCNPLALWDAFVNVHLHKIIYVHTRVTPQRSAGTAAAASYRPARDTRRPAELTARCWGSAGSHSVTTEPHCMATKRLCDQIKNSHLLIQNVTNKQTNKQTKNRMATHFI